MADPIPKQIVIPTAWLAGFMVGGLLHTGMMYQQFQQLRADQEKNSSLVAVMRENQINGLAAIRTLQSEVQRHDERIVVIERLFITKPDRR